MGRDKWQREIGHIDFLTRFACCNRGKLKIKIEEMGTALIC
jgi:hypothetical protein